jgi:hypothetical protein
LLIAGSHPEPTSAEEEAAPREADLAQFLEGFAPLAKHGEWTREEVKDAFAADPGKPSEERPQGLQDSRRLTFAAPDKSKSMTFVAARFETSAQAETFIASVHKDLLQQQGQSASSPGVSVWLHDVSKGAGKNGSLDGHAIDNVEEFFGTPFRFTFQYFHVERLVVILVFAGCSHVSRETQDAFIAYALERRTDPATQAPPSPEVRVPTREVTFSLRDPDGEPVASAEATALAVSSKGADTAVPIRDRGTLTLPKEPVKVRVGHAAGRDGRPLQLLAGEVILDPRQTEVTVTLARGDPCRIQIVGPDGGPVPGAEVRALSQQIPPEPRIEVHGPGEPVPQEEQFPPLGDGKGRTDAGGEVRLPVDPEHGSKIVVDAGEEFFRAIAAVPPGTESRTIRLRAAWRLHLTVRDRDGTPVEDDVEIRVQGRTRREKADAAGRVEIGPLPREAVHVRGYGDDWAGEVWTEVKPTRDPVVLTLASHLLRLRVLDSAGTPVPAYRVEFGTGFRATERSAEGPIALLVPAGSCSVEVREAADADGRPLNLAAAEASVSPEARELTLRMPPGVKMSGIVRAADGRPVADAKVLAHRRYSVYARAQTDAEGRYELVGLDARGVRLEVRPPEGLAPPRPRDVVPSSAEPSVDFTLPEVVRIRVVDWRGRPVRGAWVRVKVLGNGPEAGTWPLEDHTNEDGVAYLANLYPDQELEVMPQNSKDLASLRRPWNGAPLTLRLERSHTARVRVVDGLGPVTGAWIDVEGGEDRADDTGPEGRTDVIVPYRPVRLRARRSASDPWSEWVQVKASDQEVEVRIPDAGR